MTPIDIQVSRSKVKVNGHAYSLYVGEGGALVFYKHLYFDSCSDSFPLEPRKKDTHSLSDQNNPFPLVETSSRCNTSQLIDLQFTLKWLNGILVVSYSKFQ